MIGATVFHNTCLEITAAYYAGKNIPSPWMARATGGPIPISPSCVWSCQANPGADTHHPSLVHLPALQVVQRRLMQHVKLTHMLHGSGIFTNICPCPKSPSFVGKYTIHIIHGAYGFLKQAKFFMVFQCFFSIPGTHQMWLGARARFCSSGRWCLCSGDRQWHGGGIRGAGWDPVEIPSGYD